MAITVQDFQNKVRKEKANYESLVDVWLTEKVIPMYKYFSQGFVVPDNIPLREAEKILKERGFVVSTIDGYQGAYVFFYVEI